MRTIVPGDVILLRGMTGFWPTAQLDSNGRICSMTGPTMGDRMRTGKITLLVLATHPVYFTNEPHALYVLTPAGPAWAWNDGLFSKGLGNGELL
jgi:hypothetical protein